MTKANTALEEIADVIRTRQRFVVMSHVRPDGDALGCTIAMALCLKALGKDVVAWNEEGVLEKFRYLPGYEIVTTPSAEPQEFDVALVLDTSVQDRVGSCLPAVCHAGLWINIDHHVTNPRFGDLVHIDPRLRPQGRFCTSFFAKAASRSPRKWRRIFLSRSAPTPAAFSTPERPHARMRSALN